MKIKVKKINKFIKLLKKFDKAFPVPKDYGWHAITINENYHFQITVRIVCDFLNTFITYTFDDENEILDFEILKQETLNFIKSEKEKVKLFSRKEDVTVTKNFLIFPDGTKIDSKQIIEFIDNADSFEGTATTTDDNYTSDYLYFDYNEEDLVKVLLKYNIIRLKLNGDKKKYWLDKNYHMFINSLDDSVYN